MPAAMVTGLVGASLALVLLAVKVYIKLTTGRCRSSRRLDGRTAIVTGSNTGIGKETARDFARRGARVILACRNVAKAEEAREDIVRSTGNTNVVVRPLDLGSLVSVRAFATQILDTESSLHILVNNAGISGTGRKSVDGIELCAQTNHLAPTLLTVLLLDLMKRSAPARIVFVSSVMHSTARLDVDDLRHDKLRPFNMGLAYSNTKLCNVLTASHLARLLRGSGVTVNSLHPGLIYTNIWDNLPKLPRLVVKAGLRLFLKDAEEGAQTSIYVAVSEDLDFVSGRYFADCKELTPSCAARNRELARAVFERSCELLEVAAPVPDAFMPGSEGRHMSSPTAAKNGHSCIELFGFKCWILWSTIRTSHGKV